MSVYNPAAKLYILMRTHSDYDESGPSSTLSRYEAEIVGVTDQEHVAKAFVLVGIYGHYWSHEVTTVSLNTLAEHTDVHLSINEWLDPASNPLCECGHRLMHHRRKNGTGSCKHNNAQHHDPEQRHKCKGFRLAEKQQLPAQDAKPSWWNDAK
jgi:hypothetical protein